MGRKKKPEGEVKSEIIRIRTTPGNITGLKQNAKDSDREYRDYLHRALTYLAENKITV